MRVRKKHRCSGNAQTPDFFKSILSLAALASTRRGFPPLSRAMTNTAAKPVCSNCGKTPPKLMKCSACKDNRNCVRYCDRKCQKKHYKQHKEDCRLCVTKLQADDAYAAYGREYAASDRAQREANFKKHLEHLAIANEYATKALSRYESLGTRSAGIRLELTANIALGLAAHNRFDEANEMIQRGFDALAVAKAEDVSVEVYWTHMGKTISGEGGGCVRDKTTGATRVTREGWDRMTSACEAYLWTIKNQVLLQQCRDGSLTLPCGVCLETMTECKKVDDPKFERHEVLPCKHMAHVGCLPVGYERAWPPGYLAPGKPTDIGLCRYCAVVGQPHCAMRENAEASTTWETFEEVDARREREAATFERERVQRKVVKALGVDPYELVEEMMDQCGVDDGNPPDVAKMARLAGRVREKMATLPPEEHRKVVKLMQKHMRAIEAEGGFDAEHTDRMRTAVREGRLEDAFREEARKHLESRNV